MKILSLIMARAGSKRLKDKNLKKIKNYSLIERAIRISKKLKKNNIICDTLLSTDSTKIFELGKNNKVMTPWIRPKKLSQSNSKSADTALHAIQWYENNILRLDGILLLQPTSPFREYKDVVKAISLFKKYKRKVVSVSPIKKHFQEMYEISNNKLKMKGKKIKSKKDLYVCNGYLYVFSIKELKKNKNFSATNSIPFVIRSYIKSIDIDDEYDFELATNLNKK